MFYKNNCTNKIMVSFQYSLCQFRILLLSICFQSVSDVFQYQQFIGSIRITVRYIYSYFTIIHCSLTRPQPHGVRRQRYEHDVKKSEVLRIQKCLAINYRIQPVLSIFFLGQQYFNVMFRVQISFNRSFNILEFAFFPLKSQLLETLSPSF